MRCIVMPQGIGMEGTMNQIDTMSVNAIRVLAADAVQKAKSGHPGLPLGSAAMAYELWANHMNHNPKNPQWKNRDRFILSGGHGSTLLYSLLHLFGYGLTKEAVNLTVFHCKAQMIHCQMAAIILYKIFHFNHWLFPPVCYLYAYLPNSFKFKM